MSGTEDHPSFDAIVLSGGAARRLGGIDKPALDVGGSTLLDRVLDAARAAGARRTTVVGPAAGTSRPAVFVREDPPGGGPVAALAAAIPGTEAPAVAVLAGDLPFATPDTVRRLARALDRDGGADGALLVDADGRDQYLLAAYRTAALRRELARHTVHSGLPLRRLLAPLRLIRVPDRDGSAFDCDTWEDVASARRRSSVTSGRLGGVLDEWIAEACRTLGIDLDVDTAGLLDMTKTVAHGVARPAAPLTAFLVGYAAARSGGGAQAVAEANAKVEALAEEWAARRAERGEGAGT